MKKQQSGFTLIELVLVIVILGILAATALPRFSDLSKDARVATLSGLAGSIRSAAALAKATQLVKGFSSSTSVTMETTTVAMSGGYPTAVAGGIDNALSDLGGTTFSGGTFTLLTNCTVNYTNAGTGTFSVSVNSSSGC